MCHHGRSMRGAVRLQGRPERCIWQDHEDVDAWRVMVSEGTGNL